MVLVQQAYSDKKETTQRKMASRSRNQVSGAVQWPCTMEGCGKHFAREADLKRHQRTTKSHSNPTRVRNAKQRLPGHNGVVIEISSGSQELLDASSNSRSSSATPSLKGKEPIDHHEYPPAPYSYPPITTVSSASYPRLPPILPLGLPTSATRLNPPHSWTPSQPPWTHPSEFHSIIPPPHQPYYRLRISDHPPPQPFSRDSHDRSASISSSESRPHTPPPDTTETSQAPSIRPMEPVIDPSLEAESARALPYSYPSKAPSRSTGRKALHVTEDDDQYPRPAHITDGQPSHENPSDSQSRPRSPSVEERRHRSTPHPTDEIITQDGEPMLNPGN
ncbi:hypothetical protein ONZ45_g12061 [Pleurotus djamor]|nr:hypothetical protein ONZ45_g12061 [Pleurotus djamor]